jgi:hypothetical protein
MILDKELISDHSTVEGHIQLKSKYQNPKSGPFDEPNTFWLRQYSNTVVSFRAIKWSTLDRKLNDHLKTRHFVQFSNDYKMAAKTGPISGWSGSS